ncbi:MAG: hypothetical protein GY938_27640 [Ketobacter sp.]|nr:hypothetical protein [Ketobacter sp.]
MKLSFWQSWVKVALQNYVTPQTKGQYNNANSAELASWFFIEVGWACGVFKAMK